MPRKPKPKPIQKNRKPSRRGPAVDATAMVESVLERVFIENAGNLVEAGRTHGFASFVIVGVELTRRNGTVALIHWVPEYGDGDGTGQIKMMVSGIEKGQHLQRGESVRAVTVVIPLDQWPQKPGIVAVH